MSVDTCWVAREGDKTITSSYHHCCVQCLSSFDEVPEDTLIIPYLYLDRRVQQCCFCNDCNHTKSSLIVERRYRGVELSYDTNQCL